MIMTAIRTVEPVGFRDRRPAELPGRQRVALGRIIVACETTVSSTDEPLSNLDAELRVGTRPHIENLQSAPKMTAVDVTQDQIAATTVAHGVLAMRAGRIRQVGTPTDVHDAPAETFVTSVHRPGGHGPDRGEARERHLRGDGDAHRGPVGRPVRPQGDGAGAHPEHPNGLPSWPDGSRPRPDRGDPGRARDRRAPHRLRDGRHHALRGRADRRDRLDHPRALAARTAFPDRALPVWNVTWPSPPPYGSARGTCPRTTSSSRAPIRATVSSARPRCAALRTASSRARRSPTSGSATTSATGPAGSAMRRGTGPRASSRSRAAPGARWIPSFQTGIGDAPIAGPKTITRPPPALLVAGWSGSRSATFRRSARRTTARRASGTRGKCGAEARSRRRAPEAEGTHDGGA